jgi:hypothetical protein
MIHDGGSADDAHIPFSSLLLGSISPGGGDIRSK